MKPIETTGTNAVLLPVPGTEDTVCELPVTQRFELEKYGGCTVSSCWQMTWRERWRVLFTGQVWFHCRGATHPPIKLSTRCDM